ncbi:MAG TPA: hypothetical protein VGQ36_03120 [Thermoanaerobaculia bacterium]|jgi:hypothetical protein|nr:hypothetical protein [Thermoanaerobaculia bacterium]
MRGENHRYDPATMFEAVGRLPQHSKSGSRRGGGWYRFGGMRPADTSPDAFAYQINRYRELGPAGRSRIAAELSDVLRQTSLASIRRSHPEYSEADVRRTFLTVVYRIDVEK